MEKIKKVINVKNKEMKKILTLFTMLAVLVSIVSAQSGPKINYQVVVRHHDAENNIDTLYHDQTVDVTIYVTTIDVGSWYSETHYDVPTTENGLLSIVIGEGENAEGSLLEGDWSYYAAIYAEIDLGIDGEDPVESFTFVKAVPYAIQANIGPITTEMIANYSKNVIIDDDMTAILDAIRANPNGVKDGLKQWVINYMKENMDIAKDVIEAYMPDFTAAEVDELYNALNTNPNKPALKQLLKQILIGSRDVVKDLTLWYMFTANAYDIERTYETFEDVPTATKQQAWTKAVEYMTSSSACRYAVYDFGLYLIQNITAQEAGAAYQVLKEQNTVVKNHMRDIIDSYVDMYLNDPLHPENAAKVNVTLGTVNNAVDTYLQEHPQIPVPTDCTIDICNDLKTPYDQVFAEP